MTPLPRGLAPLRAAGCASAAGTHGDRRPPRGPTRRALLTASGPLLAACGGDSRHAFDGRRFAAAGDATFTPPEAGRLVAPMELTDHRGRRVGEADFAGRWMLVDFGYTTCADACPTSLGTVSDALDLLGPEAEAVAALFVSFDPGRDTPELLARYVPQFHPDLLGLTGAEEEVAALAARFGVRYWRVPPADPALYKMDHTSLVYLVDPEGRVRQSFWPHHGPEEVAAAIRREQRAA